MADDSTPPSSQPPSYGVPKPVTVLRDGVNVAVRQTVAIFGLVLIGLSIPVAFMTPLIPVGLPMAIVGVVLLGRNAVWGRRWMESVLVRHPRVERFAPNWLMKMVFGRDKRDPGA